MNAENRANVVVIGVGNIALGDEGVGSRVICEVAPKVPPGVEVVDAGLPGVGLIDIIAGREKAIIIDVVDAGGPPGMIYRFHPGEATSTRPGRSYSLHQGDVLQYIELAEALGTTPKEVVIIGIQPGNLSPGERLSPPIEEAIPKAVKMVLVEVQRSPVKATQGLSEECLL